MTSSDWRSLFHGRLPTDSCTLGIDYLKASAETIAVDVKDVSIIIHQDLKLGVGAVVWDCARFLISSLFNDSLPINLTGKVVLELGSGTGVVGIAAGFCQTKAVILTDLPDLLPTIHRNIAEAQSSHSALSSVLSSQSLDWHTVTEDSLEHSLREVDVVVMSDVLYDPVLIPPLLSTCLALTSSRTRIPDVVIGYRIRFPEREQSHLQEFDRHFNVVVVAHDGPTVSTSLYFVLHLTRKAS